MLQEVVVKEGEWVTAIAKSHGTDVAQIERYNAGVDVDLVQAGQTLVVPHTAPVLTASRVGFGACAAAAVGLGYALWTQMIRAEAAELRGEELEASLAQRLASLSATEEELGATVERLGETQAALSASQAELSSLRADYTAEQAERQRVEREAGEAAAAHAEAAAAAAAAAAKLEAQAEALSASLEESRVALSASQSELLVVRSELQAERDARVKAEERLELETGLLNAMRGEMTQLGARVGTVSDSLEESQGEVSSLRRDLDQSKVAAAAADSERSRVSDMMVTVREQMAARFGDIAAQLDRVEGGGAAASGAREAAAALREAVSDVEAVVNKAAATSESDTESDRNKLEEAMQDVADRTLRGK